jgi:mRNA interferase MazF
LFSPGDVVVLDFPGITGSKRRPAVVLSSDTYHATRPDLILGLITSQTAAAIGPTDYALQDWAAAGLRLPSAFRSFLATVPAADVSGPIGRLSDRDWAAVCSRVIVALATIVPPPPP